MSDDLKDFLDDEWLEGILAMAKTPENSTEITGETVDEIVEELAAEDEEEIQVGFDFGAEPAFVVQIDKDGKIIKNPPTIEEKIKEVEDSIRKICPNIMITEDHPIFDVIKKWEKKQNVKNPPAAALSS